MLRTYLFHAHTLKLLFFINLIGTIYGYYWYMSQLQNTPFIFIPFVPDSPTASLFFTIFLFFYLRGNNIPLIEALAAVTLIKYGIWAVVMNLLTLIISGQLSPAGYMLMISHGAMALQACLYSPLYRFKWYHLAIAAVWTLHNEIIDYVYDMMPVYGSLTSYSDHIGYFTFWLSIASIAIVYFLTLYHGEQSSVKPHFKTKNNEKSTSGG
ncbi:DUF1405 domain-containing protein [Gracilibacillus sp. YIM 98692]|uniref:DUF1405 domain-containing protein n=1 Tax=Gracilibacillus sp. YIM 98692 TaxID=2663532 RepID=UPI0013D54202|nr:DUF1405 domain-containing protein [Gracilibacillus sp. YIM 98692]